MSLKFLMILTHRCLEFPTSIPLRLHVVVPHATKMIPVRIYNRICNPTLSNTTPHRTIFKLFGFEKEKRVDLMHEDSEIALREPEHPISLTGKPRLTELSLKGVAHYMMTAQCQNILVLSGAGISAPAGIPNYRKYGGIEARKLMGEHGYEEKTDATRLFDVSYFSINPYGMIRFVQALWPGNFRPTYGHYFIKTLQEKGLLLRNWTENVDSLERLSGIRVDKLVEFHGTLLKWRCGNMKCYTEYDLMWLKERLEMYQFPNCTKCFEKTGPALHWLDEDAPELFRQASVDAENCDLLIIIGSDLTMHPFSSIPHMVPWDVPRLVILDSELDNDTEMHDMSVNFDFDSNQAYRDVYWAGNTDLGLLSLCSYLNWDGDVKYMMSQDTVAMPTRKHMQERLGLFRDKDKKLPKLR